MKTDCTGLFLHYREVARLVWNLGFVTKSEFLEWACERAYDEAMARLFEGMILRPLGRTEKVELSFDPGRALTFSVRANVPGVSLMVDNNLPGEPGRLWGNPTIVLDSDSYCLRFVAFFDWNQLASRDFRLLVVLIEELEDYPDLVGRQALIELSAVSLWLSE